MEQICNETHYLKKFTKNSLKKILLNLDPECKKKILLGSGVIEELDNVSLISKRKNFGTSKETLKILNDRKKLFNSLDLSNVAYPKSTVNVRYEKESWLKKDISSFGGTKVNYLNMDNINLRSQREYFQKFIDGEVISVQFFISNKKLKFHSICSQWNHPLKDKPFMLGGLIIKKTSKNLEKKLFEIVKKICYSIKLEGLNSVDFILSKKNCNPKFIEINARPGLSINLLSKIYKDKLLDINQEYIRTRIKFATAIIYSKKKFFLKDKQLLKLIDLSKSYDISELPYKKKKFLKDEPFCLVHAQSSSENKTKKKIKELSNKVIKLM